MTSDSRPCLEAWTCGGEIEDALSHRSSMSEHNWTLALFQKKDSKPGSIVRAMRYMPLATPPRPNTTTAIICTSLFHMRWSSRLLFVLQDKLRHGSQVSKMRTRRTRSEGCSLLCLILRFHVSCIRVCLDILEHTDTPRERLLPSK